MKNFISTVILLLTAVVFAEEGINVPIVPEFSAYLRAGVASNLNGAGQTCVNSAGSNGNEFRVGNECGIYGEFRPGAYLLKNKTAEDSYWVIRSNFAVSYNNRTDWEAPNTNNWVLREIYSEAGNFDGVKLSYWLGKKFFRWGDMHLDDYYPIDMSGPGAGVMGYEALGADWSLTVIQNAQSTDISTGSSITTTDGPAAKTSLHLRADGWKLSGNKGELSLWLTQAFVPQTNSQTANTTGVTNYRQGTGTMLAAKWNRGYETGDAEIGLADGQGAMSNMSAGGNLVQDCSTSTSAACNILGSNRIRTWGQYHLEKGRWSGQTVLTWDRLQRGTSSGNYLYWTSFAVEPMYWLTEHFALATELGTSQVEDDADGLGLRTLTRVAFVPTLALKKGYYGRPVLRAFIAGNYWNAANAAAASGISAPNSLNLYNVGFQTELWF